ncbi:hypothetical protein FPCIR_1003 [Fusarium pseudocircinatum]|uniref:Uncharacterized protein n=1 Tax=Fusarium pseudocircinatum TaxID=56676 RepID=A0A8H5V0M9_9HYPO|nr:hypothetical protein FPCIR_1003 [Fusarium pseudocircinatum]
MHNQISNDIENSISLDESRNPSSIPGGLKEEDRPVNWSSSKKWSIVVSTSLATFIVSFGSSVYSAAIPHIQTRFDVSPDTALLGITLYVVGFALGPMAWGPASELYGKRRPLFLGYAIFCICQLPCALAQNMSLLLVFRFLSGLAGSSSLAILGGMYVDFLSRPAERGISTAVFSVATFCGPTVGPIIGNLVTLELGWRWTAWLTLIGGVVFGSVAFLLTPETSEVVILRQRSKGNTSVSPSRIYRPERGISTFVQSYLTKPVRMFVREPILIFFTVYMSLAYGIIYLTFTMYPLAFVTVRGWSRMDGSLPFIGVTIGVVLACIGIALHSIYYIQQSRVHVPERRLPPMIAGSVLLSAGIFWFGWTSSRSVHWLAQAAAGVFLGSGSILVLMSGVVYLIEIEMAETHRQAPLLKYSIKTDTFSNAPRGFGSRNATRPCFYFKQGKTCKFGNRCKFLHDPPTPLRTPQLDYPGRPSAAPDGKLRQWKRLLNLGDSGWNSPDLTTTAVSQFFQLGLEMMDGDIGAVQDVIKLLAKDAGLAFTRALADVHIMRADSSCKTTLWEAEVKPLFSLITHPRVVDSAVLEQQVADVFNCILGIEGQRMTKIFNFIIYLVTESSLSTQSDSRMEILELSLSVLSKIIDCNTRNIVNSECEKLVSLFAEIVKNDPGQKDGFSRLQATKYIDYMQQRLDTGKSIPNLDPDHRILFTREDFVLRQDLPGTLSADGPRHNNDHVDITKIKIMPTYDEVVSPRGEYLPTNNPSSWHAKGIRGRLDREFRLVREDTVGQLRDAVRDILELARDPKHRKARQSNTLRTYTYENPVTIDVNLHRVGGLEMSICCHQLPVVRKLNAKKRKDWWTQSKRLQAGALVCLFDVSGSMLFCVVSDTTMRSKDDKEARKIDDGDDEDQATIDQVRTLSDDPDFLFVNLKLVDPTTSEISQAMRWYRNIKSYPRRYLAEFPGVLLDSFKHSLLALQKMHERPNIPFANLLAPKEDSPTEADIGLPQYARKTGFTFDLSCLSNDNSPLTVDPRSPISPQELSLKSSLDPTQSAALLNTLTRELSLIQGPPGTGKSFTGEKIIKVLLESRRKANLGPILCVCYTNHALDQLLEHLLDDGTKGIIRIGSRSKSERLQNLNLRNVTKGMSLTKSEKRGLWEAENDIREQVQDGRDLLKELADCQSWKAIKNLLASDYPRQHAELFGEDQDGWQTVIYQPEMVIDRWLQSGQHSATNPRPLEHLKCAQLSTLTNHERTLLHCHWIRAIRDPIIAKLARINPYYNDAVRHRDEIRGDVDLRCLNDADIVGVTTTGLARNLNLLRKLRCKVMLCEEAGEVLEAHILTALLPSIEHAILIGDHLQLRPQIQNYDLQSTNPRGKQYSLDVSLFERLVQPPHGTDLRIPYSMLETQRRMHPSIAELVRSTLYPSLNDAEAVAEYPQIVGMKRRLFWLHHDQPENTDENNSSLSTSRSNSFEVDMTAALVSHLSQQGTYRPGDIAVLTPYLGQLQLLRRRMESMFEIYVNDRDLDELEAAQDEDIGTNRPRGVPLSKTTLLKTVRVATVDNFQGEEAKVIVISLVRSNHQGDCGFLKTKNRINVLLSRAKHGMYIIGNGTTYEKVPMWADVMKTLASGQNLGTKLELHSRRKADVGLHATKGCSVDTLAQGDATQIPCIVLLSACHPVHVSKKDAITLVLFDVETLVTLSALSNLRVLFYSLAGIACPHLDVGRPKIRQLSFAWKWLRRVSQAVTIKCASNVTKMSLLPITYVHPPARIIAPVDIAAPVAASAATHVKTERSRNKTTAYASSAAAGSTRLVNIAVLRAVTVM